MFILSNRRQAKRTGHDRRVKSKVAGDHGALETARAARGGVEGCIKKLSRRVTCDDIRTGMENDRIIR